MADLYVRAPDGSVGTVPEENYQKALNSGYTAVPKEEADPIRAADVAAMPRAEAVKEGKLEAAPSELNDLQGLGDTVKSGLTFGQAPSLRTPEAIAIDKGFEQRHPVLHMGASLLGQTPGMVAASALGGGLGGLAARGLGAAAGGTAAAVGAGAGEFTAGAATFGSQSEGEAARLEQRPMSAANVAISGVVGEVLGRGTMFGMAKGLGVARNLLSGAERQVVARDVAKGLEKGGWVGDFKTAQHAEVYHDQLAEAAAKDIDRLETNFAEVSRLDRKRARIERTVVERPGPQQEVAVQATANLKLLRDALGAEDITSPAGKKLLKQLDDRIETLDSGVRGRKLWRELDQNRQALQEYAQDLHQTYADNPGSAWLSRDGLAAIDKAEAHTREALLREDVWGKAATDAQRAYNEPFHTKYFPALQTVRKGLMFSPHTNAEGFNVWRGEPGNVRKFFTRNAADVDGRRLGEYFTQYLDGAEAVAKAGERDAAGPAREVQEAVRRLRKAHANAQLITAAAERTATRVEGAATVAGAGIGGVVGGPFGAAGGAAMVRGARFGDWLGRAAKHFGWFKGAPKDIEALLAHGTLPKVAEEDAGGKLTDAVLDGPFRPSEPPPSPAPAIRPQEQVDVGAPAGGPTPTERFGTAPTEPPVSGVAPTELPSKPPSEPPPSGAPGGGGATGLDEAPLDPAALQDDVQAGRDTRRASRMLGGGHGAEEPGTDEPGLAWYERIMGAEGGHGARAAEDARMAALTHGEFREFIDHLKTAESASPKDAEAESIASLLESHEAELIDSGMVVPESGARGTERPSMRSAFAGLEDQAAEFNAGFKAPEPKTEPPTYRPVHNSQLENPGRLNELPSAVRRKLREGAELDEVDREHIDRHLKAIGDDVFQLGGMFRGREDAVKDVLATSLPPPPPVADTNPFTLAEGAADLSAKSARAHADLPADEKAAIDAWTTSSDRMRQAQRAGLPMGDPQYSWETQGDTKAFEAACDKLTVANPTRHGALYRFMELPPNALAELMVKDHFEAGAAMSTSYARLTHFGDTEFRFNDVEHAAALVGANPAEAEMVIPKDARFRITGRYRDPETGHYVFEFSATPARHSWGLKKVGYLAVPAGLAAGALASTDAKAATDPGAVQQRRQSLFEQTQTKTIVELAQRLFSSSTRPAARPAPARSDYDRATLDRRRAEFRDWQENPQQLVDRVASGFRDAPPDALEPIHQAVWQAATFLKSKLPQPGQPSAVQLRQLPVSNEQLVKFTRYEQAALRPADAMAEAGTRGYITPELHETLEALYPDMLAELRVHAMLTVKQSGPPPSVQAKLSYARLFDGDGALADPAFAPAVATSAEMAYQQAGQPKAGAPGAGPSPGVSQIAAAVAAPAGLARLG